MSTTLSPARQAHSNSPTIVEGDAGLQAFLAAAQQEAQEKWEGEVIEKDAEAVMEFEQEVVHKWFLALAVRLFCERLSRQWWD
ncbi:hypothetical protein GGU10DRAFT_379856 [Lentinula aff. detonsa]|uniref:Uncharacterized protein n=1 Tax=Lentinula aff. detonsa TaxID=2804958 RepID=A0AA38KWX4_9AGAR|nr:hypothetical protein GGU10DRAFT_379856 [Lentinula aff. detonsa]